MAALHWECSASAADSSANGGYSRAYICVAPPVYQVFVPFISNSQQQQVDERLLFDQLPHYLRGEVASFLTDEMLRESRAFGNLDSESRLLVDSAASATPADLICLTRSS